MPTSLFTRRRLERRLLHAPGVTAALLRDALRVEAVFCHATLVDFYTVLGDAHSATFRFEPDVAPEECLPRIMAAAARSVAFCTDVESIAISSVDVEQRGEPIRPRNLTDRLTRRPWDR